MSFKNYVAFFLTAYKISLQNHSVPPSTFPGSSAINSLIQSSIQSVSKNCYEQGAILGNNTIRNKEDIKHELLDQRSLQFTWADTFLNTIK